VPGSVFAALLIGLIPVGALSLIVLSVLGTFYGARGLEVPILTPLKVWADVRAAPWAFGLALLVQSMLSVAQYGCPELAKEDRRWWVGYALTLGLSVWWNIQGYGPVMAQLGTPWLLAYAIIAAGDIAPEIAAKRRT
jgi:hypothetical protein